VIRGKDFKILALRDEVDTIVQEFQKGRGERKVAQSTIAAEKRCEDWFASLMANDSRPEVKKAEYLAEAIEKFGVSKRAADRARAAAIHRTDNVNWMKPGPISKRLNS
jgi:hypothetical protein